jgi:hypothetical protein
MAFLMTPSRKLILSKYFLYGIFIGSMIILPNVIWQYHNS